MESYFFKHTYLPAPPLQPNQAQFQQVFQATVRFLVSEDRYHFRAKILFHRRVQEGFQSSSAEVLKFKNIYLLLKEQIFININVYITNIRILIEYFNKEKMKITDNTKSWQKQLSYITKQLLEPTEFRSEIFKIDI